MPPCEPKESERPGPGILTDGAALAAATLLTPAPGTVVTTSHPVFTWTLPTNEQSDALYIANKPDTTPEGKFYDENVVGAGFFFNNERQWSPTSAALRGRLLVAGVVARFHTSRATTARQLPSRSPTPSRC